MTEVDEQPQKAVADPETYREALDSWMMSQVSDATDLSVHDVDMPREEFKQEWIYWHEKERKARRLTNAADPEHGEIVRNIEAVDAEMNRRQLDFNE